ncbi:glycosyltransferase family 4 protein [Mucilaginibacter sp. KACC 22063]|uniref:glycosyltransferase family 4 protein n=1 Tax=Mucilaginibacter sp. KACC 22063 TaxID=3025666 RepID=UPI002366C852|nr:glycosyltransferase [Mucilaginibacter sp. KACC 22063]WDF53805.1 glycosyltransferase [Mucilaginibacter sp. KACC 22063]
MPRFIDIAFYAHKEYETPEPLMAWHKVVTEYAQHFKYKFDLSFVRHAAFEGEKLQDGIEWQFFKSINKGWYVPLKTLKFVKHQKPDIILVQGLGFPLQTLALKLVLPKHAKIIVQHHGESPFKGVKLWLQKLAAKCVDTYFFTSADNAKKWREVNVITRQPVYEVLEASTFFKAQDKQQSRSHLGIESTATVFLWVGRLNENKDPLTVLKAFSAYVKDHSDAQLYMIYSTEELLGKISDFLDVDVALKKHVHLIGSVKHTDLPTWYSAADYYLSASHREGSGYALLEAMACGCVPILTAIPSFKSITADGKYGYLYPPGDANALAEILLKLGGDNTIRSEDVIRFFNDHLSFKKIAEDIEQAITKISKQSVALSSHQSLAVPADEPVGHL